MIEHIDRLNGLMDSFLHEMQITIDEMSVSIEPVTIVSTGHNIKFNIGEVVYLRTDPLQKEHLVTGLILRSKDSVQYICAFGASEKAFYDVELSLDKDILMTLD
jgi:hypothetical protein